MYILGIDPGTLRTGWGVIDASDEGGVALEYIAHGCIVTDGKEDMPKRLMALHKDLNEIIKKYKPECMIVEQIFFGRNVKTAISVGQARGVIMLSAAQAKKPLYEYTSITVKHSLSGSGRAEKKEMQVVVRRLLSKNKRKLSFNAKDKGFDDAADALAIAMHHALKTIAV